jgi:hypothetical protein
MDDQSVRKIIINDGDVAKFSDGTFVNRCFLFRHPLFGGIGTQSPGIPSPEAFKWAFKYGFTDQEVQLRLKHSQSVGFDTGTHERPGGFGESR